MLDKIYNTGCATIFVIGNNFHISLGIGWKCKKK